MDWKVILKQTSEKPKKFLQKLLLYKSIIKIHLAVKHFTSHPDETGFLCGWTNSNDQWTDIMPNIWTSILRISFLFTFVDKKWGAWIYLWLGTFGIPLTTFTT
jgi:hypothetical protein